MSEKVLILFILVAGACILVILGDVSFDNLASLIGGGAVAGGLTKWVSD